jgi:hypothetical protein
VAYSKLYKVIQDHALGYQSVNQYADNEQAIHDDLLVEHGSGISNSYGPGEWWDQFGRHDSDYIPRFCATVIRLQYKFEASDDGFGAAFQLVSGNKAIASVIRDSAGRYFFTTNPIWELSWVDAAPINHSTNARMALSRLTSPTDGEPAGFGITLLEQSGGTWAPTDFEFSVSLWGVSVENAETI